MTKNTFDYRKWVRLQSTRSMSSKSLYDYFDFANQLDSTESITNTSFIQAETIDKFHHKTISKAKKNMTQTKNERSSFGQAYQKYWQDVTQPQATSREPGAAQKIADIVAEEAKNRQQTEPESSGDSSRAHANPATAAPKDIHAALRPLMEVLNGLDTPLKDLDIIDFTQRGVYNLLKESLTPEFFEKLNEPVDQDWKADKYCAKLLKHVEEAGLDQEDLIVAIRTPVIEPINFRPYKHRDLRTLESILVHWLDLVTSPLNPVLGNHGERTSAVYGVIPIVNALFLQYNNIINIEWIEIEDSATKRHKWDGLMRKSDKNKTTIMIMEFAGGFARGKEAKNNSDTKKLYRNATRVLNADGPSACALQPRVFTVLTTNSTIYFESLTQVDNEVCVRKRHATITLPTSYASLLDSAAGLPSVLSWRDATIDYATKLPEDNETNHAYEIISPLSSQ